MKWEYLTEKNLNERRLDFFGSEGWELITVIVASTGNFLYFFKRPIA
jgi:hypothetical protein